MHDMVTGDAPEINIESEKNLIKTVLELTRGKLVNSAHDVSDGGLAVALSESCIINRTLTIGCNVNIRYGDRPDFDLFNESQTRIVISFDKSNEGKIAEICTKHNISCENIGVVGGKSIKINEDINMNLDAAKDAYYNTIKKIMEVE
jgi:phosphoribosylformylglycinamidine synthase subunit PurL